MIFPVFLISLLLKMTLALVREYLNLVDENDRGRGFVEPCDIYRHISSQGIEPQKAALLTGLVTVLGGVATGTPLPLSLKTDGRDRALVDMPPELDPQQVLKVGGKGLQNQVLAIAEALLIPKLSTGLTRKLRGVAPGDLDSPLFEEESDDDSEEPPETPEPLTSSKSSRRNRTSESPKNPKTSRAKAPKEQKDPKTPKKKNFAQMLKIVLDNRALITSVLGPALSSLRGGR